MVYEISQKSDSWIIRKPIKGDAPSYSKGKRFKIVEMECNEDHIHLLVDCSPQIFIPNMIKAMKGNTGRSLFKEFPEVKQKLWGGHLWNPSYFIATVSKNTAEQVRDYIHSQKQR